MSSMPVVDEKFDARIHPALSVGGLRVELVLEAPPTADLFAYYADLVVVSDYIGFSAFARLVDPSSPSTQGFLTPERLADIRGRYGHRARSPRALLDLPLQQRIEPRNVERHCSLLHLGLFDRQYAGRFILFVPSLVHDDDQVPNRYAEDYVECAMYVAAYRRSRSVYFAGFGGTDGSFEDKVLVKLVERIHDLRCSVPLPPVHAMFKYCSSADADRVNGFVAALAARLRASALADDYLSVEESTLRMN